MHAARLDSSPRLQRVHELLSDGKEHSTREIRERAHIEAVSATVAELRDGGAEIECHQATSGSGRRVWLYRMTKPIQAGSSWREDELPCETCGCTGTAACEDPLLGPCSWTERDDDRRICSRCEKGETESNGSGSPEAEQGGARLSPDPAREFDSRPEPTGRDRDGFRQLELFA